MEKKKLDKNLGWLRILLIDLFCENFFFALVGIGFCVNDIAR